MTDYRKMAWRWALVAVLFGALFLLNRCNSAAVHYRIIAEVETPEGLRQGSSVWRWWIGRPLLALATPYSGGFSGEAVAVDLPNGQTLFALTKPGDATSEPVELIPERVFASAAERKRGIRSDDDRVDGVRRIARRDGLSVSFDCRRALPRPHFCPLLVRFRNIADPASVEAVDPDDLAASFGPGYRLRRITVQITDDPVTTGIEKRLGWLRTHQGSLNPDALRNRPPLGVALPFGTNLTDGDFRQGV